MAKSRKSKALDLLKSKALKNLNTDKQRLFVIHYVDCLNGRLAAERAGYEGDDTVLRVQACNNLKIPAIRKAVDEFLAEKLMSEAEALERLGQHARADLGDFLREDENGHIVIDVAAAKRAGLTHLVRKFKTKTTTRRDDDAVETEQTVELELHDQQAALDKILKAHGTYRDDEPPGQTINISGGFQLFQQVNAANGKQ